MPSCKCVSFKCVFNDILSACEVEGGRTYAELVCGINYETRAQFDRQFHKALRWGTLTYAEGIVEHNNRYYAGKYALPALKRKVYDLKGEVRQLKQMCEEKDNLFPAEHTH